MGMGFEFSALRMKYKDTIKYEIRFDYYRYNTGAADNGHFHGRLEYDSLDRAKEIYSILQERLKDDKYKTRDFLDSTLGVDGFITQVICINKVETKSTSDELGLLKLEKTVERLTED